LDLRYHEEITRTALGEFFDEPALAQIIAANFSQDSLINLVGKPYLHFDDDEIAASLAYVDGLAARITAVMTEPGADIGAAQRQTFGQLTHTVQDFYAHSNYVDLWLASFNGDTPPAPNAIPPLDAYLLNHPDLHTGTFKLWRDIIYYIPGLKHVARKVYIPLRSHEAMHLDNPARGEKFPYALAAAARRTRWEYLRAADAISAIGGDAALHRFRYAA